MSLTVTYPKSHEAWYGGSDFSGAGGTSATHDVPVKMLVADSEGHLIPCDYQYWYWGNENGVGSGNHYIPSGEKLINPETLVTVKQEIYESEIREGEGFHAFIRDLMHNFQSGAHFIKYEGAEEITQPQAYWYFFGIRIAKKQQIRVVHRFSLCRLQSPLDEVYEAEIAEKKRQGRS